MLKTILAAAAAIAASSVALPAMAQCTGDQMLTSNPDGSTTCGGETYTVERVPEAEIPHSNPFTGQGVPPGAAAAVVDDGTTLWLDQTGAAIAEGTRDSAPGDGVWEPDAYKAYKTRQGRAAVAGLATEGIAIGFGTAALVSAPSGLGPFIFGGIGIGYQLGALGLGGAVLWWSDKAEKEFEDYLRAKEECERNGCSEMPRLPGS